MKKKNENLKGSVVKTSIFTLLELLFAIGFFSMGNVLWGWICLIFFFIYIAGLCIEIEKLRNSKNNIEIT